MNGVEGEYMHKSNSTACRYEVWIRRTISTTVQELSLQPYRVSLYEAVEPYGRRGLTTNTTVLNYVHSWIKNTPAVAECSRCLKINAYHASNSKVVKAYGNLGSFPSFGTEVSLDNPPSSGKWKGKNKLDKSTYARTIRRTLIMGECVVCRVQCHVEVRSRHRRQR